MLPPALAVLTVHGHAAHPLGGNGPAARPARCGLGAGSAGRRARGVADAVQIGGRPGRHVDRGRADRNAAAVQLRRHRGRGGVADLAAGCRRAGRFHEVVAGIGSFVGRKLPTGRVGPVVTTPQVVVVHALPGPATAGVQLAVRAGPTVTVLQVMSR